MTILVGVILTKVHEVYVYRAHLWKPCIVDLMSKGGQTAINLVRKDLQPFREIIALLQRDSHQSNKDLLMSVEVGVLNQVSDADLS